MEQRFIDIGSLKIRYLEGSGGGNVSNSGQGKIRREGLPQQQQQRRQQQQRQRHVLFIHGLGSSGDRWLDIPDALAMLGFHTVAIDLPGFGWSSKPEDMDYTVDNLARTVTEFMEATGMSDTYGSSDDDNDSNSNNKKKRTSAIVGHSLGGYIAAKLASERADLVDRLVLVDSSGMLSGPTPLLQEYLDAAMNPTPQSVRKVFGQMVADPIRVPEVVVSGFMSRMQQPGAKHSFKSAYDNSTSTQIGKDRLRLIGNKYNIQTMIVWGSEDRLIPIEYSQVFSGAMSNSQTVVVKDAGHAPFAEKPAVFFELLREFLAGVEDGNNDYSS